MENLEQRCKGFRPIIMDGREFSGAPLIRRDCEPPINREQLRNWESQPTAECERQRVYVTLTGVRLLDETYARHPPYVWNVSGWCARPAW